MLKFAIKIMLTHHIVRRTVTGIAAVVTITLVSLPFFKLANFYWYTPACFYSGLTLLVLAVLTRAKAAIGCAIGLLLWTFAAPFLLLLLPEVLT